MKDQKDRFTLIVAALLIILVSLAYRYAQVTESCERGCDTKGAYYVDWHFISLVSVTCICSKR